MYIIEKEFKRYESFYTAVITNRHNGVYAEVRLKIFGN